jgi:hypothetical protein
MNYKFFRCSVCDELYVPELERLQLITKEGRICKNCLLDSFRNQNSTGTVNVDESEKDLNKPE